MVTLYAGLALFSLTASTVWGGRFHGRTVEPQQFPMLFYQQAVGHLDGRSCPSYPVCSLYARQAIAAHGWIVGSWLAMDRLIHEADDLHGEHWIMVGNERRNYDPLSRNDRWMTEGESNEKQ